MKWSPHIAAFIASDAPLAVVFLRRGRSRTHQLLWNLDTDELVPGQWIRARMHLFQSDLSPNGRYLIGSYVNHKPPSSYLGYEPGKMVLPYWTAVSRPSYFTALAVAIPVHCAWDSMGGYWDSNDTVYAEANQRDWRVKVHGPTVNLKHVDQAAGNRILPWLRREHQRHSRVLACSASGKPFVTFRIEQEQLSHSTIERCQFLDEAAEVRHELVRPGTGTTWADVDHRGRVLFADKGCIFIWHNFPEGRPRLFADLHNTMFEQVPPPAWALEWK